MRGLSGKQIVTEDVSELFHKGKLSWLNFKSLSSLLTTSCLCQLSFLCLPHYLNFFEDLLFLFVANIFVFQKIYIEVFLHILLSKPLDTHFLSLFFVKGHILQHRCIFLLLVQIFDGEE